eukprot:COSAG01_NODE_5646_length_4119_cov_7.726119_5_plen_83_part_00
MQEPCTAHQMSKCMVTRHILAPIPYHKKSHHSPNFPQRWKIFMCVLLECLKALDEGADGIHTLCDHNFGGIEAWKVQYRMVN